MLETMTEEEFALYLEKEKVKGNKEYAEALRREASIYEFKAQGFEITYYRLNGTPAYGAHKNGKKS